MFMRRITAALTIAATSVIAANLVAQPKPNFSGKWTLDPSASAAPAGAEGGRGRGGGITGWGQLFTATQDANTLTVEYTQGENPVKVVYKLDGSDSTNMMPRRQGGEPIAQVSKAVWDGAKLNITTTVTFGGNSFEIKRAVSLDAGNLVLETTAPAFGGNTPTTTKAVYKKS
jgi:hypothetical protein